MDRFCGNCGELGYDDGADNYECLNEDSENYNCIVGYFSSCDAWNPE
jgi:hypothetical protein